MPLSQEPIGMRLSLTIAGSWWEWESDSEHIIAEVQKNVAYLSSLPKTTDDLYREYTTLMHSQVFMAPFFPVGKISSKIPV